MALSLGKWRGLQQTTTARGVFAVLALDHRGNLRRAFSPDQPDSVPDERLIDLKRDVAQALTPASSAILIDPETGGGQCLAEGWISGGVGLIWTLDATGYTGDPHERVSEILNGWSVEKACQLGAAGVKLLVYYHPDAPNAREQESLVEQVGEAAAKFDVPFFMEPLSYSLDRSIKKLPSDERRQVVIETARRLCPLGVDILKAEFPVDVHQEPDEKVWFESCLELSEVSPVPWLLLSAGVDFETYLRQSRIACEAGASGVMAGRAVWKEAVQQEGEVRNQFLRTQAYERMLRLRNLCDALARPFTEQLSTPALPPDWYVTYPDGR